MRISHIKISNILGIEELELSPKGYTQISGQNGQGKTSVLEAIKAALGTGHDATLLRNGAEKGEAVLVLEDGTEISRTVTASTSTTTVRRDGKKVPRPAEVIRSLADVMSVNPVDFLAAKKTDRARVLLESMPIEVDLQRLSELVGAPVEHPAGMHGLMVIDTAYKAVFDARTGTNRAVKEKAATIKQLTDAVPPLPEGVEDDEDAIQAKIEREDEVLEAERTRIDTKLAGLRTAYLAKKGSLHEAAQADIEALRQQIAERQAKLNAELQAADAEFNSTEAAANTQRNRAQEKHTTATTPLRAQMATIRNSRELTGRRNQTLETISALETEQVALEQMAEQQTQALEGIKAYKDELLASLPIAGLEVRDGEIYRDDVPLDRLNTAQQVQIAVDVAKLRAGPLGIACVDRLESLDAASRTELRKRAAEAGLQLFVTRVTDKGDGLTINTTD